MELWIRSQDKHTLIKADYLYSEKYNLDGGFRIYVMPDEIEIAKYKKEERALEVLDEIQDLIKPKMVLTKMGEFLGETCDGTVYSTPNEYDIKELSTILYEMPKE